MLEENVVRLQEQIDQVRQAALLADNENKKKLSIARRGLAQAQKDLKDATLQLAEERSKARVAWEADPSHFSLSELQDLRVSPTQAMSQALVQTARNMALPTRNVYSRLARPHKMRTNKKERQRPQSAAAKI